MKDTHQFITVEQLRRFVISADLGSFEKGARSMNLDPSAVIRSVNKLESGLQSKLFRRTSKGLILTREGYICYSEAQRILEEFEDMVERVQGHCVRKNHYWEDHLLDIVRGIPIENRKIIFSLANELANRVSAEEK